MSTLLKRFAVPALSTLLLVPSFAAAKDTLVVYSARNEHLITPLFDAYQKNNDVKIEFITDKEAPLLARLKAEGENTPADILMTVDGGNLWHASNEGVLKSIKSETLEAAIPSQYRSSKMDWFGFSLRARTIFFANDRVDANDLSSYEDLADPKWAGKLCLRTSKKVYNQSLVATMMATLGSDKTSDIVEGWVANLAAPVFSSDTKMLQAIEAGQCDLGIANTYYFGRLKANGEAKNISAFWPNQENRGTHVNVSGAGVTKHSDNPVAAQKFLEWLSTEEAQRLFADLNQEYPANPAVAPSAEVAAWGEFKADSIDVEAAGKLQVQAVMLMDNAGYK